MATGHERYRRHPVWETLRLKRDALYAARFDSAEQEQWRTDIVEWLDEAAKTKLARQPVLYLSALDALGAALNQLPVDAASFQQFINQRQNGYPFQQLEASLRSLPLPPPKELSASYIELLDREARARNELLSDLEAQIATTSRLVQARHDELVELEAETKALHGVIEAEKRAIAEVSASADAQMRGAWEDALTVWQKDRESKDLQLHSEALAHVAMLAATASVGANLAEHAAGDLSAADWYGRAKRERAAAQWIRFGAWIAFIAAGSVGAYIVSEAIVKNFDISIGGGILRASITVVIGAFGVLLLRESARHFREADTAEDVALSLAALAPFYANSDETVRLAARVDLGDAVLVKNVLSRFTHRDAAKHGADIKTEELPSLVRQAADALRATSAVAGKS